jgi:hypothetical protein
VFHKFRNGAPGGNVHRSRFASKPAEGRLFPHALILVTDFQEATMNQTFDVSLLCQFGTPPQRVERALEALARGDGILLVDDEDRENEGDLIFSAQHLTPAQMALMIRECSGIVCLCLTDERIRQLELPMMVEHNTSKNGTAFTVTIEAREGVTTGVSAQDMSFPCGPSRAACSPAAVIPRARLI